MAFYDVDDWVLEAPDDDAYDLVIAVAQGRRDVPDVAAVLSGSAGENPH